MIKRLLIVDYQASNLKSVQKAFEFLGVPAEVSSDPVKIAVADVLVLPGQGAFQTGIKALHDSGLYPLILAHIRAGKPYLGICLGFQFLFEESEENGIHKGFGVFPGRVVRFQSETLTIPQIGWNTLAVRQADSPFLWNVPRNRFLSSFPFWLSRFCVKNLWLRKFVALLRNFLALFRKHYFEVADAYTYFVHSYYIPATHVPWVLTTSEYGVPFVSAVGTETILATQFHPEKSGDVGLQILRNFIDRFLR